MAEAQAVIGEVVSHYRILGKLGAGGMGVVYKALDEQLQRTVALKFLPAELAANKSEREKLLQEARAASALDHPNIGVIYGLEDAGEGKSFISMGYYEGETLSIRLARGTPSVRDALDLAVQIASGLAAAHAQKIVHRDIKPGNIILTKDNQVKIVDFGLARVMAITNATLTVNTSGTLPYMAPEQILGEAVDPRADVWALGVILVELLTGQHPFLRENSTAMTFAILNQPPGGIEDVPAELQPIVYRALSKETLHRYPTGKEIYGELQAARAVISSTGGGKPSSGRNRVASPSENRRVAEYASKPRWAGAGSGLGRFRKWWIVAAILAALVLGGAALLSERARMEIAGLFEGSVQRHIAVLPFESDGTNPGDTEIARGLMDSLTSKLSNLDGGKQSLWVVPASVVRSRRVQDPTSAARDLGATLVVTGSMERAGPAVHLTVNLIDAKNLRQMGSASVEDPSGNLEKLQDQAVTRLAKLMGIRVIPEVLKEGGGEAAPVAYESYLKALGYMQRYDKPGNVDQAISALNSAVAADPEFALGFASLGEAYRLKNQVDPNPKWIEEATSNLDRAVHLDDRLAGPYVSLGYLHNALAEHDLALQEFEKALAINPRDPEALVGMASVYDRMGRAADAETAYKKAIALRPDYWDSYNSLGNFYDEQGRYREAVGQYKKVIELTPDNTAAYSNLGAEYMSIGDDASNRLAEEAFKKSIAIAPTYAAYANLGNLYMGLKRYDEAAAMTRKALELNDKDYRVWCNLLLDERNRKNEAGAKDARELAEKLLEAYLKKHPQDATAQSWMAIFRSEEKQKEQALQSVDSAVALAPKDSLVLTNVAETYENLGDRGQAVKYAEESMKNGSSLADLQSRPGLRKVLDDKSFHASGNN